MFTSQAKAIASVTANGRSRLGYYRILEVLLLEQNLWLRLERPDGTQDIALEQLSHSNGQWHVQLLHGLPMLEAKPAQEIFTALVLTSPDVLRWIQVASNKARFQARLDAFRRSLSAGFKLRVNGYSYALVRRARGAAGYGWVVERDGTPLLLQGRELDLAIRNACPK